MTPPSPTQVMIAPDGSSGEVPVENVQAAVNAGGKLGMRMTAPDGSTGVVPVDRAHDAVQAGGMPSGIKPSTTGVLPSDAPAGMEYNTPAAAASEFGVPQMVNSAKQSWAAGQAQRDAEAKVVQDSIASIKKGDYGTAAENLLSHIASGAMDITKNQIQQGGQDLVNTAKGVYHNAVTPTPKDQMLGTPIMPMPGISGLAEDFADEEAANPAAKGPGVVARVKQAINPKAATQPGTQSTLRAGAQASAADAGITGAVDTTGSIRTLMDKPIADTAKIEKGLYNTLNESAGTDMKDLFDYREQLQDALDDPTQISNHRALAKELSITDQAIKVHSDEALTKGVVTQDTLDQAKAATQQRYAMEEGAKKLFNNESTVSGNVAHGVPEESNTDALIKQAESMDKPSKYAPQGSPTRLQQMFGKDGAFNFKQGLYDAQKAGKTVLARNDVLRMVGKVGVVGKLFSLGGL
jgi:hypothetical protein